MDAAKGVPVTESMGAAVWYRVRRRRQGMSVKQGLAMLDPPFIHLAFRFYKERELSHGDDFERLRCQGGMWTLDLNKCQLMPVPTNNRRCKWLKRSSSIQKLQGAWQLDKGMD